VNLGRLCEKLVENGEVVVPKSENILAAKCTTERNAAEFGLKGRSCEEQNSGGTKVPCEREIFASEVHLGRHHLRMLVRKVTVSTHRKRTPVLVTKPAAYGGNINAALDAPGSEQVAQIDSQSLPDLLCLAGRRGCSMVPIRYGDKDVESSSLPIAAHP
jgi:hypothetical protein